MKNRTGLIIAVVGVLSVMISLPYYSGAYFLSVTMTILLNMTLAVSWDMMLRTGQLSFGIAGFFGIGSYVSIVAVSNFGVNNVVSIFLAAAFVAVIALALAFAILKLRGIYFAITTLALTMVFSVTIRNMPTLTGGSGGKVLYNTIFNGDTTKIYWLILTMALFTILLSIVFEKTRVHYAISSIRNDEVVAKSSGINVFKYLTVLFVITAMIQGVAGAIYTQQYGFAYPETAFSLDFLMLPMAMALVGGIYSTWGSVIGSVVLGLVAEYLRLVMPHGSKIIYGIIVILIILFLPKGIYGTLESKLRTTRNGARK